MVSAMEGGRARSALAGTQFADVRWVEQTGSTNAELMELARSGGPHGAVLFAGHQLAGRGRLDRSWEAAPGEALLASVLVRPALVPSDAHRVTTALGVAAAEACSELSGVEVGLKWPNDLVAAVPAGAGPRKLGGLLAESVVEGDALVAVVAGLGVNVAWPLHLPGDLEPTATSLGQLAGADVEPEDLLVAVLRRFDGRYSQAVSPTGWPGLLGRYRELCTTIGQAVSVEVAGGRVEGIALDVTAQGLLLVSEAGFGRVHEITAGDVVHLRPGPA